MELDGVMLTTPAAARYLDFCTHLADTLAEMGLTAEQVPPPTQRRSEGWLLVSFDFGSDRVAEIAFAAEEWSLPQG